MLVRQARHLAPVLRSSSPGLYQAATRVKSTIVAVDEAPPLLSRFTITAEAAVSKLFPAGFGWQLASVLAENSGYGAEQLGFFTITGAGDMAGVFLGHTMYFLGKKMLVDKSISMAEQAQVGLLLGSAAFCSGFCWQPIVNALQGADLSFNTVVGLTTLGCGGAFFAGLRLGRGLYSNLGMSAVPPPTEKNLMKDANLSLSIGAATGAFVGTDTAYRLSENWLSSTVGIYDKHTVLEACALAGTSTSLGFLAAQTPHNLSVPTGRSWQD
mmetsp:Transcript_17017/g.64885  ORF Transcript_17017/g.64885 Transcript_17017/m.64885 type:complete len:269 (-) Transcript_17017:341-1147(-)